MIGWIFGFMMRRSSGLAIGAGAPSSVQVIEVEVDTLLGRVRVLGAHSGVAVGKLAAPTLARNQAAGAVIQGLGYALYEGREIDRATGDVLTTSLDDYRMPGIGDIPPIDVYFDEGGFDHVHGGSVGIGEVATVPTAAAIANAVRDAIGVSARTRSRSGPTGSSNFSIGGPRHDGDGANRPPVGSRPNSAPRAPTSRSAAAAASRAGRSSTSRRLPP